MGLLDRFKRISDPVDGTAHVVSVTAAPDGHGSAACGMHLVVNVPGAPAFPAESTHIIKMSKWPRPGMVLPITASRSQPTRFKVRWNEVSTGADLAAEQAARLAASMNGPTAPSSTRESEPLRPQSRIVLSGDVSINGRAATAGEAEFIAGLLGPVLPGGRPAGTAAAGGGGDSRIERLERLAALRQSGVISAEEFERLKAEVLEG